MKRIILGVLLLLFLTGSIFASEVSSLWSRLYEAAKGIDHKYKIMLSIVEQHDRDMIPVLIQAIQDLNTGRENIRSTTERVTNYNLTTLVIRELGYMKAVKSADDVYRVLVEISDPFLKAEAIDSLGAMGARDYTEELSIMLKNINIGAITFDTIEQKETVVSALISALERMKMDEGLSPVFFSSIGRYSHWLVQKAEQSLAKMVEDPTDTLLGILELEDMYEVKLKVLQAEYRSNASDDNKVRFAVTALREGIIHKTNDVTENSALSSLRILSAEIFRDYGSGDDDVVELLEQMLYKNFSITETLTALEALGQNSSDASALVLSDFLKDLNDKRQAGYTFDNERIVKGAIIAMGQTENQICLPELMMVEYSNWSGAVTRLAKSTVESLQGN